MEFRIYYYECPDCGYQWETEYEEGGHDYEDCQECQTTDVWPEESEPTEMYNERKKKQFINNQKQFEMKEINVTLNEGQEELVIRQGQAAEIHELGILSIKGTLNSPAKFLTVRKDQIDPLKSHVIVNQDLGTIHLIANDREEIGRIEVVGELKLHPDFVRTGVNQETKRTAYKLAMWIRMNRTLFESNDVAAKLVTDLRHLKAKVEKHIEDNEDDRANVSMKRSQAVESNIPKGFKLSVPLFVGAQKSTFNVEVVIDPDDLSCSLLSPDAADLIKKEKETAIAGQVKNFKDYVVIYV
jgi:hypothetical protein